MNANRTIAMGKGALSVEEFTGLEEEEMEESDAEVESVVEVVLDVELADEAEEVLEEATAACTTRSAFIEGW